MLSVNYSLNIGLYVHGLFCVVHTIHDFARLSLDSDKVRMRKFIVARRACIQTCDRRSMANADELRCQYITVMYQSDHAVLLR